MRNDEFYLRMNEARTDRLTDISSFRDIRDLAKNGISIEEISQRVLPSK